jgi:hypothetical protein
MADMMKNQQQNMANMMKNMRPPGAQGGMPGAGAPGAGAGPGALASNADTSPADFSSPLGAVQAFLNALKAKDLDRLNEATALRAQLEATARNRDLFKKIFDLTLSDSELDDLAKRLADFSIAFENPATSTGRLEIIVRKNTDKGGYLQRKITVRKEKKGWGVMDIGSPFEFKSQGSVPKRRTNR